MSFIDIKLPVMIQPKMLKDMLVFLSQKRLESGISFGDMSKIHEALIFQEVRGCCPTIIWQSLGGYVGKVVCKGGEDDDRLIFAVVSFADSGGYVWGVF